MEIRILRKKRKALEIFYILISTACVCRPKIRQSAPTLDSLRIPAPVIVATHKLIHSFGGEFMPPKKCRLSSFHRQVSTCFPIVPLARKIAPFEQGYLGYWDSAASRRRFENWSRLRGLNPRPSVYKSGHSRTG